MMLIANVENQREGILSGLIQEIRLNKVSEFIKGKNVLDVGCGNGKLYKKLSRKIYYLGVDKCPAKNPSINFLQIDIEKKFSLKKKFDTLVLSAVLEHFDDPFSILKKLLKRLTKSGIIIITTPTKLGIVIHRGLSWANITSKEAAREHNRGLSKDDFTKFEKLLKYKLIRYEKFLFGLNQLVIIKKAPAK